MASQVTPKKNAAFTFYVSLRSQSNPKIHQANPTLAAGDVKVAIDDGAPANLATLPAVDADFTKRVKVSLSASEMNGDNISVIFSDAAGDEWCDLIVNIQTTARQVDDLAWPTTSGRSLDVTATGAAGIDWGNIENKTTVNDLTGTTMKDVTDVQTSLTAIAASLATIANYIDTEIAAIKAKTDNLPSDPADASDIASSFSTVTSTLATIAAYLDTEIAAIKAKTDNLPADPADASDISASFVSIANTLATIATYIDSEVAAIKAKTDNLPSDPADASDIATATANILTEVGTVKAKTDLISDIPTAADIRTEIEANGSKVDHLWEMTEDDGGMRRFTEHALEMGPAGEGGGGSTTVILSRPGLVPNTDYNVGTIVARRGDTFQTQITDLGDLSDADEVLFTVKSSTADADTAAILQVSLDLGLLRIAGSAPDGDENGEITIDDDVDGDITVVVSASEMAKIGDDSSTEVLTNLVKLPVKSYFYDVQKIAGENVTTLAEGVFKVSSDVARTVS
jgi:cell division protein ZapA (FtsZ GTPase activity inhibitor)